MEYGLIGSKLGHSYSKIIHDACGYRYDLCPLPTEEEARASLPGGSSRPSMSPSPISGW